MGKYEIIFAGIVGTCIVLIVIGLTLVISSSAFDNGYCEALGGERITSGICEVDGKVVRVP